MFIQTETTPNPATLKFLPGLTVLEMGTADFTNADAAAKSPLAARVFRVSGVTGVFLGSDFVTVTKDAGTDWDHIKPAVLGAIMEHFQSGQAAIEARARLLAAMPSIPAKTVRLSRRSRNSWIPACALPLRKMAAISPSTGSSAALSICICRALARAALPRH